ncbi:hypothetical protein ACIRG5_10475 [Lentzea sp. NPDC102401]|uniref:hypothetical protein n=1 Tax=Lentzea sp. NPDC102401 TaxID=3364128 RepID=UPI003803C872
MFTTGFADDPLITKLWRHLDACEFTEVLELISDIGPEPVTAAARARWRELMYIYCATMVVLVRYADAEQACRLVLRSAENDDDHAAKAKVLGYGIAAAFFLGNVEVAVSRLDEVLAAAEEMPAGPDQMSTFVAAAIGAGMIGFTELSDQLVSHLVDALETEPAALLQPALAQFLHSLLMTRRCQLAISLEQRRPSKSVELYRSVVELHGRIGVEIHTGTPADMGWPPKILSLYLSHICFAKIAIGESAEVADLARSAPVTGHISPFDTVAATTEIMWGLCQLRLALAEGDLDSRNRFHWHGLARALTRLAQRTQTLVLQAETTRVFLELARRGDDTLLCAVIQERHEAAVDELDWTARLEHARFSGLRSQTMRAIANGVS